MRDVFAFAGFAQAVAFDGAGKNYGGAALVFDGGFVGGIDFARIVAAEAQAPKCFVGQRLDELRGDADRCRRIVRERTRRTGNDQFLILAVDHFAHALDEQAFGVAFEDRIPLAAPENFDDVPARAAEGGFEFLNDLAVAAHGTVEALKVAIDDENQIVELFARGQRDGAQRFGLVGFAVAEERPDFGVGARLEAAIFEIAIEARLINRHQRAQAHRDGGKFPEIRHQPGMRIGRQAAAGFQFAAEIFQLLRGSAGLRETRAHKCRERRGPENKSCRLRNSGVRARKK